MDNKDEKEIESKENIEGNGKKPEKEEQQEELTDMFIEKEIDNSNGLNKKNGENGKNGEHK